MIRVTVELLSAIHPPRNQVLAMMDIANDGEASLTNHRLGSYTGVTYRGRDRDTLELRSPMKRGAVVQWRRLDYHVWNLVARMLESMGYDKGSKS